MTLGTSAYPLSRSPFDDVELTEKRIRPLWTIPDFNDSENVLKWCNDTTDACWDWYGGYFKVHQDNLWLYRGIHWIAQDRYQNRWLDRQGIYVRRSPRVVINHLYDFVEHRVSRLTRYRPSVAIYPATAEQQASDDAKTSKDVLDYTWHQHTIDSRLQNFSRDASIFGESFLWITWDPNKGEIHPAWAEAQERGQRVPVLGPDGEPILSEKGEPLFIQKAVRTGDIKYENVAPWHVFEMPCRDRDQIDWAIRWSVCSIDYLKAKSPDKAAQIKKDESYKASEGYGPDVGQLNEEVIVYELFHRQTEFLDQGRYIKWCRSCVLENTVNPYPHGDLPYVYMRDIEVPDQIRGMSIFQQLFPMQHQINAIASLIYKTFVLLAHPKIVAPEGSIQIEQLLNESTVISYSGGVAPFIMNTANLPPEMYRWLEVLQGLMEKIGGINSLSRGEAPSGVRAAKALRVLEEQEDKRSYILATKYNHVALVQNAKMTLSVMGAFCDDSDGRFARILGRDNEYRLRRFKAAALSRPYEIRIENTTALSQSPAARIEDMIELAQTEINPTSPITKEQFLNMIDMTASEQFKDITTRAAKCAQSENDDFASGAPVADPQPDEDLITHLKVHYQLAQSRDYKERMPGDRKIAYQQHIYRTEYLAFEKAYGITLANGMPIAMPNQAFAMLLQAQVPQFPVYFKLPTPSLPPMGMMGGMGMPEQPPLGPEAGMVQQEPLPEAGQLPPQASTTPPPLAVG